MSDHGIDLTDEEYQAYYFSDEAREERRQDCNAQAARHAALSAQMDADTAAALAKNPWPTDPTAMRGRHMGLQEWIRERGD